MCDKEAEIEDDPVMTSSRPPGRYVIDIEALARTTEVDRADQVEAQEDPTTNGLPNRLEEQQRRALQAGG